MSQNEGNMYEYYIAVYFDDLALSMKDPQAFCDILMTKYSYKLKGTGPIVFHLGCDFFRDEEGCLCFTPCRYVDKMCDGYKRMFGEKPNQRANSPHEKGGKQTNSLTNSLTRSLHYSLTTSKETRLVPMVLIVFD